MAYGPWIRLATLKVVSPLRRSLLLWLVGTKCYGMGFNVGFPHQTDCIFFTCTFWQDDFGFPNRYLFTTRIFIISLFGFFWWRIRAEGGIFFILLNHWWSWEKVLKDLTINNLGHKWDVGTLLSRNVTTLIDTDFLAVLVVLCFVLLFLLLGFGLLFFIW